MPRSYVRVVAAGLLAGAVACGSLDSVRLRQRGSAGRATPLPGTMPGDLGGRPASPTPRTPDTGDTPFAAAGTRYPGELQVCRTAATPRGWIAVAYVSSAGQCPARLGADSAATAAVLTRYADHALGMELDVCADQALPRGWALVQDAAADVGRCPGATRGEGPTSKRIRRYR